MKKAPTAPKTYGLSVEGQKGQEVLLAISGRISLENSYDLSTELQRLLDQMIPAKLSVDLAKVEYLDSSGALALVELEIQAQKKSLPFAFLNPTEETDRILELIDRKAIDAPPLRQEEEPLGIVEQVGRGSLELVDDVVGMLTFFGEVLIALVQGCFRPHLVRWGEVLVYMQKTGVDALPILATMSLLLGTVLAFMSSFTLQQFGAIQFVSALVGVAFVRALGALLTGILMAGRSGSAFAAEIGTMKVNEEVDALDIMGFEPVKFLAVPKVLASIFVMPILTIFSMFFGIAGGFLVGVTLLDISVYSYIKGTQNSMTNFDFFYSLIQAAVFGLIIAAVGCHRGFQVRGGASEVGTATTSAVVTGLFLTIVACAIFSILSLYIR